MAAVVDRVLPAPILGRHDAASMTEHPNVLLVVMDAVRATSLEPYGATQPTSPFLCDFAGRRARMNGHTRLLLDAALPRVDVHGARHR